jgi:hypothetical protein
LPGPEIKPDPSFMKKFFLGSLLLLSFFSCKKYELENSELANVTVCGVSDPLKELAWLKTYVQESTVPSDYCTLWKVTQGEYHGQTVYLVVVGGALCCTCGNVVYNCEGEVVFACDAKEESKMTNTKVIWKRQ